MPRATTMDFIFRTIKKGNAIKETADDLNKAKRGTEEYADGARKTSRASEEAEASMGRFSQAAGKLGDMLKGGFTLAIGVAGGAVTAAITDFLAAEESMRKFSAQTGITGEALSEFKDTARSLFLQGLGDSFDEVVSTMQTAHQLTGAVNDEMEQTLTNLTRRALRFNAVFGTDTVESMRTADTVADNFGISASNAFDLMTVAMQQTGDPAGDLLDTFTEYSANFDDLGLDAADMFEILNSGLEAGARNTDDIADGVREFGIRVKDGTSDLALWRLGLSGMKRDWQEGRVSGDEFFDAVIQGLNEIEDPIARNRAGVELFGTKWEDVGEDVFLALETSDQKMRDFIGSTDEAGRTLEQGPGHSLELLKRNATAAIQDTILPLMDDFIINKIPNAINGWNTFGDAIKALPSAIVENFDQVDDVVGAFADQLLDSELIFIKAIGIGARIVEGIIAGINAGVSIVGAIGEKLVSGLEDIAEAAVSVGNYLLNGMLSALGGLPAALIDMMNEAIPNEISFGSFKVDLGPLGSQTINFDFDIDDNPIPGGTRDTGLTAGGVSPGSMYQIGQGPYKEFFVPSVPGQVMTPAQAGAGGGAMGGIVINGNMVFPGVQDTRTMQRELGRLDQRQNRAKAKRGRR